MPAQTPDPRTRSTWAERTAALAAEPSFRALVADREPPTGPRALSRRERRALLRAARRRARQADRRGDAPAPRVGPRGLARGSAVAVTASLLVSGGLGAAGAAGHAARYGGVGGVVVPFSAERAVTAHGARLTAQVDDAQRASHAEQLAVAGAALDAAAAVRPLAAQLAPGDDVPAQLEDAVGRLTALVRAGQPLDAARMQAEVPLPPAPPVVVAAPATTGAAADVGAPSDAASPPATTGPSGGAGPSDRDRTDDGPAPRGTVPELTPLVPVRGPATPAPEPAEPAEPAWAAPGADGVVETADQAGAAGVAGEPAPLAGDVTPTDGAAPGTGAPTSPPPGSVAGVADAPGAPADSRSQSLSDLAGEVFRLSMQVEMRSTTARLDASVVRVGPLEDLESTVTAAGEAADELERLKPLVPLTEAERLALARREEAGVGEGDDAEPLAGVVRARARLRADVPAGVAALTARWPNGRIPTGELCPVEFAPGHRLQCDAAAALARLNVAYRARFGTDLAVVSSYRTLDTQVSLRAEKPGLAAVPGTSNHGWGLAVDLGGIGGLGEYDAPGYLWLQEHAGDHGWHHPRAMEPGGGGPPEPWHWEFGTD